MHRPRRADALHRARAARRRAEAAALWNGTSEAPRGRSGEGRLERRDSRRRFPAPEEKCLTPRGVHAVTRACPLHRAYAQVSVPAGGEALWELDQTKVTFPPLSWAALGESFTEGEYYEHGVACWVEIKIFKVAATWVKRTRFDRGLSPKIKRTSTVIRP